MVNNILGLIFRFFSFIAHCLIQTGMFFLELGLDENEKVVNKSLFYMFKGFSNLGFKLADFGIFFARKIK